MLGTGAGDRKPTTLIEDFVGRATRERKWTVGRSSESETLNFTIPKDKPKVMNKVGEPEDGFSKMLVSSDGDMPDATKSESMPGNNPRPIHDVDHCIDSRRLLAEQILANNQEQSASLNQVKDNRISGIVQTAFDRMRPKRTVSEVATITIGSKITTALLGSTPSKRRRISASPLDETAHGSTKGETSQQTFGNSMRTFAAPGTQSPRFADKQSNATHSLRPPDFEDNHPSLRDQSCETGMLGIAGENNQGSEAGADDNTEAASGRLSSSLESTSDEVSSDGEYLDEQEKILRENAKVAKLIAQAEEKIGPPSEATTRRAQKLLKAGYSIFR